MRRWLWLLAALGTAGCDNSNGTPPPPFGVVIGPGGGQLTVGTGLLQLDVPPGAVAVDTRFAISEVDPDPVPGWFAASPAFRFDPQPFAFAVPATITMPYSTEAVSVAVANSELRVAFRSAPGAAVEPQVPLFAGSGIAQLQTSSLGAFWVLAPDVVDADSLWPLGNNDSYSYDSGLVLDVARTATEPNIAPLNVAKVTLTDGGTATGIYFDDRTNLLALRGTFDGTALQEVWAASALLISTRDPVGSERSTAGTLSGFRPLGQTTASYTGVSEAATAIVAREHTNTLLGTFLTVHVALAIDSSNTELVQRSQRLELWFARRIGPVAIRRTPGGPIERLAAGTVGGTPLTPR
jgi:hypothetical protein